MILTRFGNKRRLVSKLEPLFPAHKMRIELFFGAGGSYFYLPKPKYAVLNDLDDDVTNLYLTLLNDTDELIRQIELLPTTTGLIEYWKKTPERDPVKKAIRFLMLSNFTYLGKGDTLRLGLDNAKQTLINNIEPTLKHLSGAKITSLDFREVLGKVSFSKGLNDRKNCFVYLDPVYLDTEYPYKVPKWSKEDSYDCLLILRDCGIKAAMSEFAHPFILKEAKNMGLNIITLGERGNIKNRKTEILITNYSLNQYSLI